MSSKAPCLCGHRSLGSTGVLQSTMPESGERSSGFTGVFQSTITVCGQRWLGFTGVKLVL